MTARFCPRCLLPDDVPGLGFDEDGLCDICQSTPPVEELTRVRERIRHEIEGVIEAHRSDRRYECVVAYSGGKDSSYTLKVLVETYRLRCLAVTIDNGFLAGRTLDNCRTVCAGLGVDHLVFTPARAFMDTLYAVSARDPDVHPKAAIRRASAMCNSCIGLINAHMIQTAVARDISLIAGGYIGGQVPRDASLITIGASARQDRLRASRVDRYVRFFGEQARAYFELPPSCSSGREITVINPMLGLGVTEREIVSSLEPLGWRRPADAGLTSTNCRMNDLGVHLHHRRHGFHPYAFEIADQLRHGLLTREEAERRLHTVPTREQVGWLAERIGVELDAL